MLAAAAAASAASDFGLLADDVHDDFEVPGDYSRISMIVAAAVVGGTFEALASYFFEGGFLEDDDSEAQAPSSPLDEDEPLLDDHQISHSEDESLLGEDQLALTNSSAVPVRQKSIPASIGIGIYAGLRFTLMLVSTTAAYAACKQAITGNEEEGRVLASLSMAEYLGTTLYTLLANLPFSFLTDMAAQFNLSFNAQLPASVQTALRRFFTGTHVAEHMAGQLPLIAQLVALSGLTLAGSPGLLTGVLTGLAIANLPVAGTTYLFESREALHTLTGQEPPSIILPNWLAQALYTLVPGPSAFLHGIEGGMPVALAAQALNLPLPAKIIPAAAVGFITALGNYLSEGKEAKSEIIDSLAEGTQILNNDSCLFLRLKRGHNPDDPESGAGAGAAAINEDYQRIVEIT
ncbi:hypothetical protein AVI53_01455 [Piscirickettsia salmonis]|nr:hypothetical protein PSLF89_2073 [Piscirickettsia salmonis LF-89 = ATCC VR-1361]ALY04222.1 hypothetical protein AWE47_07195 [Piscirickettsia salmonis]AMA43780.1 hypothetical protein AWJ11_07375 [Piscirickettsia salmonis]AOS36705.1 hypothetical protein AVM72_04535 [Piscirickettsia salmonis]APS61871.1 hypothetical protein AVI53_01455 [Piscirickettsia salmonis]